MNWKTTWTLAGLALGLFVFIMVFERHITGTGAGGLPVPRLLTFQPDEVEGLQMRRSDQLTMEVRRTNSTWELTFPRVYPVPQFAVEGLLDSLSKLEPTTTLEPKEIKSSGGLSAFQLDVPVTSLVLRHRQGRDELRFGSKTPLGDEVYVQVADRPQIYTVEAAWLDRLPTNPNAWRDRALIQALGLKWDRLEVRMPNRGFAIQFDPTNRLFYLSKPTPARADQPKVQALLEATMTGRVLEFVDDNVRADLEPYRLQNPSLELVFGVGTNDVVTVQFGGSPTNNPNAVYARCLAHTNIVLVSRELVDSFRLSHAELREKRLLTFDPKSVDVLRIKDSTNLTIQRDGEGGWEAVEPRALPVDSSLMKFFFSLLSRLEGDVERDVATDLTVYGLAAPTLTYSLQSVRTNGVGVATNQVLAELEFGSQQEGKVHVRRTDEQAVYTVDLAAVEQLPTEAWQLRDLRVWSFSTNEVKSVEVRVPGRTIGFIRKGPGQWSLAPGSQGIINSLAVEEVVYRLGQLRAEFWVARQDVNRARFGFRQDGYKISVVVEQDGQSKTLEVEFGEANADQFTYALTQLDGAPVVFEFPKKLHFEIVRDLMLPFMQQSGSIPQ